MTKITDTKAVRGLLSAAAAEDERLLTSLTLAKQIVDFLWEEHGITVEQPLAEWEKKLLAAGTPEPTPWQVSKFRHDPIILAKFLSKEDALAYLAEQVGNTPSSTEFSIQHIH